MREKRIIAAGLPKDTNWGDPLLFECCKRLYARTLLRHGWAVGFTDCNLRPVGTGWANVAHVVFAVTRRVKDRLPGFMTRLALKTGIAIQKRAYAPLFRTTSPDAVIVAGGGVIHFKVHAYLQSISALMQLCKERGIPMIVNSVGIEEYDTGDIFFKFYRPYLNDPVIKAFTTRDSFDSLSRDIICTPGIYTRLLPDNAILSKSLIGVGRDNNSRTIGVGIIRPNIFDDYQDVDGAPYLVRFYQKIIERLERDNRPYELFSNGTENDMLLIPLLENAVGRRLCVRQARGVEDLMRVVSGYKGIITARMHAAIVAYSMGIPAVALNWCRKIERFFAIIGSPGLVLPPPMRKALTRRLRASCVSFLEWLTMAEGTTTRYATVWKRR